MAKGEAEREEPAGQPVQGKEGYQVADAAAGHSDGQSEHQREQTTQRRQPPVARHHWELCPCP
jgi:hypothetical protein